MAPKSPRRPYGTALDPYIILAEGSASSAQTTAAGGLTPALVLLEKRLIEMFKIDPKRITHHRIIQNLDGSFFLQLCQDRPARTTKGKIEARGKTKKLSPYERLKGKIEADFNAKRRD